MKILDLPEIHHYLNRKDNYLYKELAKTNDTKIFNTLSVRALIEQKWPKTKDLVINKILYPFLGFMTVFITYTLMDFMVLDVSDIIAFSLFNFTLCLTKAVLYIFMSYFISIEVKKAFSSSPKKYLNQPSLYLDLIPCVLIIFSDFVRYYEPSNVEMSHFIRLLFAIIALAMWLKLL